MEKDINSYRYYESYVEKNISFFQKYYYHAILDLNLVKLANILKNGLLTRKYIEGECLYTEKLGSYDCKNGDSYISITEFTADFPFNTLFNSFAFHTLSSPSIMINHDIEISHDGLGEGFDDERFIFDSCSPENFVGILLPQHLQNQLIKDTFPFFYKKYCLNHDYIKIWLNTINEYFSCSIPFDDIDNMVKELWEIINSKYHHVHARWNILANYALKDQKEKHGYDLNEYLANTLQELWDKKLQKRFVNYFDILNYINIDKLPIYILTADDVIKKLTK